jgi:hypothetical protein
MPLHLIRVRQTERFSASKKRGHISFTYLLVTPNVKTKSFFARFCHVSSKLSINKSQNRRSTPKKKKQPDRFFEIHLCIIVYEPTFASFSKICGYSNFCKKKDNIITANQKERRRKQRTQPVI